MGIFDWFKKGKNEEAKSEDYVNVKDLEENTAEESAEEESLAEDKFDLQTDENITKEVQITEKTEISEEIQEPEETETVEDNIIFEEPIETNIDLNENFIEDETLNETSDIEIEEDVKEESTKEIFEEEVNTVSEEKPKGFFAKIKSGLAKTRNNIMSGVEQVLKSFTTIDEELYEELEEALIMADLGVDTSVNIIEKVRECVKKEKINDVSEVKAVIVRVISEMLEEGSEGLSLPNPSVILVIGVNGVGKTTTIGKLTANYKNQGKSVLLAAADTFRAAAIDQLEVWGERSGVDVIKHQENSDPAAVVFDAVQAAKARKSEILICDTAGRLHNKKNLMEELRKIAKIINREYAEAHVEVFLVLDATTGQNALQQAKLFKEVADISGIVLTKLDGTAKGGIVIAIKNELNIPVRFIGVGEGIDDLQPFNAPDFAKALFDSEE